MGPIKDLPQNAELPSATGESLCALCAEKGTSCCRTDPELTYLSFPLSLPEWQRLKPYTGLATSSLADEGVSDTVADTADKPLQQGTDSRQVADSGPPPEGDEVCAPEPNEPEFIASMHAVFPSERQLVDSLFPEKGTHFSMRTRKDGSCVFLGATGCRLPRKARPWYCLIFPAWIVEGSLSLFLSPDCLISQRARGPAHGVRLLEEEPAHIRDLHSRLCRDWGLGVSRIGKLL